MNRVNRIGAAFAAMIAATGLAAVAETSVTVGDYMVIDLNADANGKYAVTYEDLTVEQATNKYNTAEYQTGKLVLRRIAANDEGYFCDPGNVTDRITRKVSVTRDYWVGLFEVTEAQYAKVTGVGGLSQESTDPVSLVSYEEIRGTPSEMAKPTGDGFVGRLLARCVDASGQAVTGFDLPTEAQWEIACRAGTDTMWCFGNDTTELKEYAVYYTASAEVGTKLPNAWGLYDMHGGVWEFCRDAELKSGFTPATAEDFCTQASGGNELARVRRGGSWNNVAGNSASSYRIATPYNWGWPAVGFRLCRTEPATVVFTDLPEKAEAEDVVNAIVRADTADGEGICELILKADDPVAEYQAFRDWAAGFDEADVRDSLHAADSYAFGAAALFENEPEVEFKGVEPDASGSGAMGIIVEVSDDGTPMPVSSEKVAAMFEATTDLGDWTTREKQLEPRVTDRTGAVANQVEYTVTPGDGTAEQAFIRIRR